MTETGSGMARIRRLQRLSAVWMVMDWPKSAESYREKKRDVIEIPEKKTVKKCCWQKMRRKYALPLLSLLAVTTLLSSLSCSLTMSVLGGTITVSRNGTIGSEAFKSMSA